jgi:hypothetical protein
METLGLRERSRRVLPIAPGDGCEGVAAKELIVGGGVLAGLTVCVAFPPLRVELPSVEPVAVKVTDCLEADVLRLDVRVVVVLDLPTV